jgi:hypothetical protein
MLQDGADKEPGLGSADGDRGELQQATTAQGGIRELPSNEEIHPRIRPLLKLSRETIV